MKSLIFKKIFLLFYIFSMPFFLIFLPIFIIIDFIFNVKRVDKTRYFNEKYNPLFIINKIKRYKETLVDNSFPTYIAITTSAGEISTIETLFEEENVNLFLLTTSTTGRNKKALLKNQQITYMPFPLNFYCFLIILALKPQLIIFLEHEFWPSYFFSFFLMNIPIISMQIRANLFKNLIANKFYTFLLKFSKIIFLTEKKDKYPANFPFEKVKVFDVDIKTTKKRNNYKENKKIFVTFASTHLEEENIFFETIRKIKNRIDAIFVIAPRHPQRSIQIKEKAKSYGIESILYSEIADKFNELLNESSFFNENSNLLILDKFGLLDLFYSYSVVAIVGGTFSELGGGHNIYEPILSCCTVVAGPYLHNMLNIFNEAIKLKIASFSEDNPEELSKKIIELKEFSQEIQNKKGTISFDGSPFEKIYLSQIDSKQHILYEILKVSRNC